MTWHPTDRIRQVRHVLTTGALYAIVLTERRRTGRPDGKEFLR
ncbi:hypothetical protein AB0M39_14000 [Streptomyces sp. NPDC051907]